MSDFLNKLPNYKYDILQCGEVSAAIFRCAIWSKYVIGGYFRFTTLCMQIQKHIRCIYTVSAINHKLHKICQSCHAHTMASITSSSSISNFPGVSSDWRRLLWYKKRTRWICFPTRSQYALNTFSNGVVFFTLNWTDK